MDIYLPFAFLAAEEELDRKVQQLETLELGQVEEAVDMEKYWILQHKVTFLEGHPLMEEPEEHMDRTGQQEE